MTAEDKKLEAAILSAFELIWPNRHTPWIRPWARTAISELRRIRA